MSNEQTKQQIRRWIEATIKNAKNPSPREKMRRLRKEKVKKIAKRYGF